MLKYAVSCFGIFLLLTTLSLFEHNTSAGWLLIQARKGDNIEGDIYRMNPDGSDKVQLNIKTVSFEAFTTGGSLRKSILASRNYRWLIVRSADYSDFYSINTLTQKNNPITLNTFLNFHPRYPYFLRATDIPFPSASFSLNLTSLDGHSEDLLGVARLYYKTLWSADGQWLYFSAQHPKNTEDITSIGISRVNINSPQEEILTNDLNSYDALLPWSPSYEWIYFYRYHKDSSDTPSSLRLYRMRPDGTAIENLGEWQKTYVLEDWIANGEWLLFRIDDPEGKNDGYHYLCFKSDGSEQHYLMSEDARFTAIDTSFASQDDLLLVHRREGQYAIYGGGCQSETLQPITNYNEWTWIREIMWSRDRQWIFVNAFVENQVPYARTQVYRIQADGTQKQQITHVRFEVSNPQISPDGRWLYFEDERNYGNLLMRVSLDGSHEELVIDCNEYSSSFRGCSIIGWLEVPASPFNETYFLVASFILIISPAIFAQRIKLILLGFSL